MSEKKHTRSIKLDYIARVEGEGSFSVKLINGKVESSELRIFESPRFFEGILKGRSFREAPDITARICGICPVAYQMSAVHAMEKICGFTPHPMVDILRRILYCGEWIESHALHTFMLHVPDFLGYTDAFAMSKMHPDWVEKALKLKKTGNDLVNFTGGREIHPINVKVGGFYRYPRKNEMNKLLTPLKEAMDIASAAARWMATLEFPDFQPDYQFIALSDPDEYPMNHGRLISNFGLDILVDDYEDHFSEDHVPYSTTLHTIVDEKKTIFTGPLARFNLNFEKLSSDAQNLARDIKVLPTCNNPFKSLLVRMVEVFYACEEAIRLINAYQYPDGIIDQVEPKAGRGVAITEAPRGILFHRYTIDDEGTIKNARIVAPTSHNQKIMESDLRQIVEQNSERTDKELTEICETTVRNYDPCISCSTHFLNVNIDRG